MVQKLKYKYIMKSKSYVCVAAGGEFANKAKLCE